MSYTVKKIALIARPIREQQEPVTVVTARLPLPFVKTTIKLISSKTFEHSIYEVPLVYVAISKIECALH